MLGGYALDVSLVNCVDAIVRVSCASLFHHIYLCCIMMSEKPFAKLRPTFHTALGLDMYLITHLKSGREQCVCVMAIQL